MALQWLYNVPIKWPKISLELPNRPFGAFFGPSKADQGTGGSQRVQKVVEGFTKGAGTFQDWRIM